MTAMTPEPLCSPRPCPVELLPSGIKQAIKAAEAGGWSHEATFAIGPLPEGIASIVFRARRQGICIVTRHESKVGPRSMSFAAGWRDPGPHGIPARLGFRAVIAELRSIHE